jgi:hypothetical protein
MLIHLLCVLTVLCASACFAGTRLGDDGHFLRYAPRMHLLNSDGRAFDVTIHLLRWPIPAWNPTTVNLALTAPDGHAVVSGKIPFQGPSHTISVPAGAPGVYLLEMNLPVVHPVGGPDFWVESTLDHSVVETGDPRGHAVMARWLLVQCSVPRRWWFWVPEGTRSFDVHTQWINQYQSQREDWGISIFSPRGQRVRMLWGDAGYDQGPFTEDPATHIRSVHIPLEPGQDGRFWSVELRFADSHNYSKISLALDGVPPFLARSPEEWFDPRTGKRPPIPVYDDDAFMQFAREGEDHWPGLQHFSPCPALGDPDGSEVRGDGSFFLWNPAGRTLRLRVGTYLPRDFGATQMHQARVQIFDAAGATVMDALKPLEHLHGDHGAPEPAPLDKPGIYRVQISDAERWFAFTYPATPLVLEGLPLPQGGSRFHIEAATPRNWYFLVPRGTRQFRLRASAQHDTDVMSLEINAPDRTQAMIYRREGEVTVTVPGGLDGKLWHLRPDVGSATVMHTDGGADSRYLGLYLTLDLEGVPRYLSPTWEQWFDPKSPKLPDDR